MMRSGSYTSLTEGRPKRTNEPQRVAATEAVSDLKSLLDIEYFLIKIFAFLLKDGLHECRRVCRKWYKVCNKMPVKLNRIGYDCLPDLVYKCPNATSVSISSGTVESPRAYGRVSSKDQEVKRSVFRPLAALIKREQLAANPLLSTSPGGFRKLWLESFDRMTSFAIKASKLADINSLFAQIGQFTKLTSLTIEACGREQGFVSKPVTTLCGVRHLILDSFLTNDNGNLMFPSLTNLTSLECVFHRDQLTPDDGDVFKVQQSNFSLSHENCCRSFSLMHQLFKS